MTITRRLLAVLLTLVAGLGVLLGPAGPSATAESVHLTPQGRYLKFVDVDRTHATLTLTARVKDQWRSKLNFQEWAVDYRGGDGAELFVDWFKGSDYATVSNLHGDDLPRGCKEVPARLLSGGAGASVRLPGRCLQYDGVQPATVRIAHVTVEQFQDRCRVQRVPKEGYLRPLAAGRGARLAAPTVAGGSGAVEFRKGC